jgi:hypothetical protein
MKLHAHLCKWASVVWFIVTGFTATIPVFAQTNAVSWFAFDGGTGFSTSTGIDIRSSVGQTFVGPASNATIIINSGLFADTAFAGRVVGVEDSKPSIPSEYSLGQNFPNPFNPTTVISYQLSVDSKADLRIYDLLGREVAVLVNGIVNAGYHELRFDATELTSGVYLYRLHAGPLISVGQGYVETRRLIVLK